MMVTAEERAAPALALGYVAIAAAVLIWAGWVVATRDAMLARHTPLDVAIFRYCTPALLLSPFLWRKGLFPRGESPLLMLIMTIGWGGPFVMLISQGLQTVEASLFGPLVPGLLPMVVALWGVTIEGEKMTSGRKIGLALIALALLLIIGPAALTNDSGILRGAPWLLAGCAGWSAFTIAFRRSKLTGAEAAAYVSLYSSPFLIVAAAMLGTDIFNYTPGDIGFQILVQGVLSGAISVAAFGYAVKALGLARSSAFTSLVPVGAAVGGWLILGEAVGVAGWGAVGATCVGVFLVNRYAA